MSEWVNNDGFSRTKIFHSVISLALIFAATIFITSRQKLISISCLAEGLYELVKFLYFRIIQAYCFLTAPEKQSE